MIDQEKIKARSSVDKGRWMSPSVKFRRGQSKSQKTFEIVKTAIGLTFAACMAGATVYLIYTIFSEGSQAVSKKLDDASKEETTRYIQVGFKPKDGGK